MRMKKVLIIRFSSIGDIVLTTPVIRSLKLAHPEVEVHYLTKAGFAPILQHNPYIDQLHLLTSDNWKSLMQVLKAANFDHIIDLHHNLRTLRIKWALRRPSSSFDKQNLRKFRMVHLKAHSLTIPHIVDRYLATLRPLGIQPDGKGLDFFLSSEIEAKADAIWAESEISRQGPPLAIVLGATYATKRWIPEYFVEFIQAYGKPVVLLGGPDAIEEAKLIKESVDIPLIDAVGTYPLLTAAALMKRCQAVLSHDTGFMHIAAAFGMSIYSLWGNTVPEFGMTPYQSPHKILEVQDLSCRPCSKIGFDQCPKGHFACMRNLTPEQVLQAMEESK